MALARLCENVWQVDIAKDVAGRHVALAWFSPDCKHFSKAKGGKPVEKNIRGLAWVVAAFLAQHNSKSTGHPAAEPLTTITAKGHQQRLVSSHIVKLKGTCKDGHPVTEPMATVGAKGTHLGEVRAFLIKYFGTDQDPRLEEPLHTVTAKDRFGLVMAHGEPYQVVDIGMRMLTPRELFRAQGFPDDYIINPIYDGKPLTKDIAGPHVRKQCVPAPCRSYRPRSVRH